MLPSQSLASKRRAAFLTVHQTPHSCLLTWTLCVCDLRHEPRYKQLIPLCHLSSPLSLLLLFPSVLRPFLGYQFRRYHRSCNLHASTPCGCPYLFFSFFVFASDGKPVVLLTTTTLFIVIHSIPLKGSFSKLDLFRITRTLRALLFLLPLLPLSSLYQAAEKDSSAKLLRSIVTRHSFLLAFPPVSSLLSPRHPMRAPWQMEAMCFLHH